MHMTLKKASYATKPQAQHMMFNRAKEDEHHGRRRNRLESAWTYLLWNMVTGIGVVRRHDFCHFSKIRWVRRAAGHNRSRIHLARSRTSHRLCYMAEEARPSLTVDPANRSGNMCDHPFYMGSLQCLAKYLTPAATVGEK